MRKFIYMLLPSLLLSKVHYAKVEPFETSIVKSAVSGRVIKSDISSEGRVVNSRVIIEIDSRLDKIKLASNRDSIKLIDRMIKINRETLTHISKSLERQEAYFDRIDGVQSISISQKDKAFYTLINTKRDYLNVREKIKSLEKQKLDLQYSIEQLKDTISKKSIRVKRRFIDKIFVHKGDFVNAGISLVKLKDLREAKLTLFLEKEELEGIESKKIYINGKKTNYKVSKIWLVTDDKFISSYRAEIIVKKPKNYFSELWKVEIR